MAEAGEPGRVGLDTNVLLRYLVADDPAQHATATHLIEVELTPDRPGMIHPLGLCEVVWALRRAYGVPKEEIVATLRALLRTPSLRVLEAASVEEALVLYASGPVDFADSFLHVAYREAGGQLATFDRAASRLPDARLL